MTKFDLYVQCEEFYVPSGFAQSMAPEDPDQDAIDEEMARQDYLESIRQAEQEAQVDFH